MKKFLIILFSLLVFGAAIFAILGIFFTNKLLSEKLEALKNVSSENISDYNLDKRTFNELQRLYKKNNLPHSAVNPNFVRIKSEGSFRTNSEGDWKKFNEESYYSLNDPAFLSNIKLETGRFLWVRDIDLFINGEGTQLRKFLSTLNLREETGIKISGLFLMRYLSDMVYYPSQFFNNNLIEWKKVSAKKAVAEIKFNEISVIGEFVYNELGEIESFKSTVDELENEKNRTYLLIKFYDYKSLDGYFVPTNSVSSWITPDVEYEFKKSTILRLEYNLPELFEEEEQMF